MNTTVLIKNYKLPQFNKEEILRYAGCKEPTGDMEQLVDECIRECEGVFTYKVCYCEVNVKISEDEVDLLFMKTKSKSLIKNLAGCQKAVVFGATVGIGIDRLIAKYGRSSPAKAVILQAIGAERIESLCGLFNEEIKGMYENTHPRFSPGYGDLPVELQKDIFRLLDCPKNIGLSLNNSMMMSPSKSVTAIIGVKL